ncbi:hypothetical protein [Absidia glauca]|uniref:G-protein coupled receptors family 2 profile 2 domain-containing protein n=1 Tax=Absidia glauca TaxID=4829 RepID=A0A163JGA3_ABSGL|nr:hypothetical protein [Absidia glauca]
MLPNLAAILTVAAFGAGLVSSQNTTTQCTQYPGDGICATSIYAPLGINATESQFLAALPQLKEQMGTIDPSCVDSYYRYACSSTYPTCNTSGGKITLLAGCLSTCQEVERSCSLLFTLTNKTNLLPDCKAISPVTKAPLQPDDSCNLIPPTVDNQHSGLNISALPADTVLSTCPAPFLVDPVAQKDPTKSSNPISCRFGCCVPCPYQNYFYNQGWPEHAFFATDIVRSVSAVAVFFIMFSYFVLPDKRRHPSLLILNFSVAVFLFSFVAFFSVGDPKRLQCADEIRPSTQETNSLCAAQGAILMFSSLATVLWCCALIINLHLHTVWSSNFFTHRYFLLHLFCWGVPVAFMATALGMKQIQYEFANLCLVSLDQIFNLFFYPMAAIVIPSFVLHICTFLYIARAISFFALGGLDRCRTQRAVRHKHVIQAVHIQWRAALLAIIACATVLFYWIFYFTQIRHVTDLSKDTSILDSWLQCMITPGNTQDSCVSIVSSHLPPFGLMVAAEALVSVIGIWVFLIFAKRSIFIEWNDMIYNIRVYLGGRGRAEKHGEQFFQL